MAENHFSACFVIEAQSLPRHRKPQPHEIIYDKHRQAGVFQELQTRRTNEEYENVPTMSPLTTAQQTGPSDSNHNGANAVSQNEAAATDDGAMYENEDTISSINKAYHSSKNQPTSTRNVNDVTLRSHTSRSAAMPAGVTTELAVYANSDDARLRHSDRTTSMSSEPKTDDSGIDVDLGAKLAARRKRMGESSVYDTSQYEEPPHHEGFLATGDSDVTRRTSRQQLPAVRRRIDAKAKDKSQDADIERSSFFTEIELESGSAVGEAGASVQNFGGWHQSQAVQPAMMMSGLKIFRSKANQS